MCVHVLHVCEYLCLGVCACACGGPKLILGITFDWFFHLINLGRVSPSNPEPSNMMCIASPLALGTPLSLSSWAWNYRWVAKPTGHLVGSENPNSSLHICMVNAFTTCSHSWDIVLLPGPGMIFLLQPPSTGIMGMHHTPGNKESSVRQSQVFIWSKPSSDLISSASDFCCLRVPPD